MKRDVDALRGVGSLLEEDSRGRSGVWEWDLADVDWDGTALASEYRVHDWDVLVSEVGGRRHREEENARLKGVGGIGLCGGGISHRSRVLQCRRAADGFGVGNSLAIDVAES